MSIMDVINQINTEKKVLQELKLNESLFSFKNIYNELYKSIYENVIETPLVNNIENAMLNCISNTSTQVVYSHAEGIEFTLNVNENTFRYVISKKVETNNGITLKGTVQVNYPQLCQNKYNKVRYSTNERTVYSTNISLSTEINEEKVLATLIEELNESIQYYAKEFNKISMLSSLAEKNVIAENSKKTIIIPKTHNNPFVINYSFENSNIHLKLEPCKNSEEVTMYVYVKTNKYCSISKRYTKTNDKNNSLVFTVEKEELNNILAIHGKYANQLTEGQANFLLSVHELYHYLVSVKIPITFTKIQLYLGLVAQNLCSPSNPLEIKTVSVPVPHSNLVNNYVFSLSIESEEYPKKEGFILHTLKLSSVCNQGQEETTFYLLPFNITVMPRCSKKNMTLFSESTKKQEYVERGSEFTKTLAQINML